MDERRLDPPGITGLLVWWHYPIVGAALGLFIAAQAFEELRAAWWALAPVLVLLPLNRLHDRWAAPARPVWLAIAIGIAVAASLIAVFFSDAPGFGVWLYHAAGFLTFVLTAAAGRLAGRDRVARA